MPISVSACPQDGTPLKAVVEGVRNLVGNYEFLEFIGSGGMGVIYKAKHPVLNRLVAVKMLHSHLMTDMIVKRFQHEARAVSGLSHPNIIAVHDFGLSEHGQPYMVMDFLSGKPLSEVLRQGPLKQEAVLNIAIQIAEALQHAHERGVLHRDLKPSNIMVTDADCSFPEAKIVDFGIAKIMESQSTRVTQTGELIGTPQYMSPEQCRGGELDARSDVYSLGCVMFEALTGKPPFAGESMVSVIVDQISKPVRSLGEVRPDIVFPIELEDLLAKALAKEPVDRFQSMNALLAEAIDVQKVVAQAERKKASIWRLLKLNHDQRHVLLLSIAAAFTLIGVASSALLFVKTVHTEALKKAPPPAPIIVKQVVKEESSSTAHQMAEDRVALIKYTEPRKLDYAFAQRFLSTNIGLKELDCRDSKIDDLSMVFIGRQAYLSHLYLLRTPISDKGLTNLRDLEYLSHLSLDETHITAKGLKQLSGLPMLTELSVSKTQIGNEGLEALCRFHLNTLQYWENKIDEKSFGILSKFKSLERLNIGNCKMEGVSGLAKLAALPQLHALNLENDGMINDAAMPYLCKIKTLEELELAGTSVTLEGIKQLRKLPHLKYIKFKGAPITQEWIPVLAKFPSLILLSLNESQIDDATLALMPKLMPKLENLDLEKCKNVTDAGLLSIRKIKSLFWVKVSGTQVTEQAVKDYRLHPPNPSSTISF